MTKLRELALKCLDNIRFDADGGVNGIEATLRALEQSTFEMAAGEGAYKVADLIRAKARGRK